MYERLLLSPSGDRDWFLIEEGVDLAREREIESILTTANGYLSIKASIAEGDKYSRPSIFVAGIYVVDKDLKPRFAVLPHWLRVKVTVENRQLSLALGRVLEHRRLLDMRQGALFRQWRQQDPSGRITRLTYLQLASLADRHVIIQSVAVTAENYVGRVTLASRLAPRDASSTDVTASVAGPSAMLMSVSQVDVAIATASELHLPTASRTANEVGAQGDEEQWSWEANLGETVRLDRIVTIFTSREVFSPAKAASDHIVPTRERGLATIVRDHVDAWGRRWDAAGVRIVGDEEAQRALRFAIYHLIAATNPADEHLSIGARGLTGEAYRGHVFWDTEIYMLPFYIFNDPPAARSLLMYRYHTLGAARRKAKAQGYKGALFAWESADTGDETTPESVITPDGRLVNILTGKQAHHISADIAYAVWQYWRATGDDDFMIVAGAEILVETARFWASRAQIEHDCRAHIRQVIGPDEYHETVDDNAYTNTIAIFNLECAADAAAILEREQTSEWRRLSARFGLTKQEANSWRALAAALTTGFDPATKLIEQFAGYFQLEEVDVAGQRGRPTPLDMSLGPERVRRSKAIKQADVVALSALLWEKWPIEVHEANFRYYEPRTAHGSSLSPALYALVAARLGDGKLAQAYFRQAAEIDLADMGNAAGGVHMGALGGLWQAAVFGAAGLKAREDGIALDPHLLPGWTEMAFSLQWRGRLLRLHLKAEPACIEVAVETGNELALAVLDGPSCRARAGQRYVVRADRSEWGEWQEVSR